MSDKANQMTLLRTALIAACVGVAGCDNFQAERHAEVSRLDSPQVSEAKRAVGSQLKDPNSAQFQNVNTYPDGVVCGEFNAKNAMGGYVGFAPFIYRPIGSTGSLHAELMPAEEERSKWCNEKPNKVLNELIRQHAERDASCTTAKLRASQPLSESEQKMGKQVADAINAANAVVEKTSCSSASEAKMQLDSYRARTGRSSPPT